jgi:hypothetical protein
MGIVEMAKGTRAQKKGRRKGQGLTNCWDGVWHRLLCCFVIIAHAGSFTVGARKDQRGVETWKLRETQGRPGSLQRSA